MDFVLKKSKGRQSLFLKVLALVLALALSFQVQMHLEGSSQLEPLLGFLKYNFTIAGLWQSRSAKS